MVTWSLSLLQVGTELELVSKDERELESSRAELEALLTQQRSAHASSADCSPSTSSPGPSQEQGRGSRQFQGGTSPKQAPSHIQTPASGDTQERLPAAGEGAEAAGDIQVQAGKGSSSPGVRLKGGPPFASISSGARAPKCAAAPGAAPEQQGAAAAAAVQEGSDVGDTSSAADAGAAAADQAVPQHASNGMAAPAGDTLAGSAEPDVQAEGSQEGATQDGSSDAAESGSAPPDNGLGEPRPVQAHNGQDVLRDGAAPEGTAHKRPGAELPAKVAWVHGKSAARPLRVAAGGSMDALRQRRGALSRGSPLPPAPASGVPDRDVAAPRSDRGDAAATCSMSGLAAEQPQVSSGADDRRSSSDEAASGAVGTPEQTLPPASAAPAPAQVDDGREDRLAALWAREGRLRLSSRSWGARAYAGPEGDPSPAQGGGTSGVDRWHPRRPVRRTARSSLRHGRCTLQARACGSMVHCHVL